MSDIKHLMFGICTFLLLAAFICSASASTIYVPIPNSNKRDKFLSRGSRSMKKISFVLILAIALASLICMSSVASAIALNTKYVGNTIVDLSWSQYWSTDFSKYVICRDGSPVATIENRAVTFYRDSGLTKGVTYGYAIYVYNSTGWLVDSGTTSAKTGDVHGTITRDTTWTAASSPYVQTGSVTVQKGVHFTIQPGVKVDNAALYIYETLNVKSVSFNGFVEIYNSNDSSIQDCSFDCSGADVSCLHLESCNGAKIIGNTVSGSNWSGISISGGGNNILTDNIVANNGFNGITLSDSSNNTIHNNIVSDNNDRGIGLYSSNNSILTDNTALNNSCGIALDTSSNNILTNNSASYNYVGFFITGSNNILTNNIASYDNSGFELGYPPCKNNIISDNSIYSNNEHGILLVFNPSSNTISNNNIFDTSGDGIALDSSDNNLISNNNIYSNDYGIWHYNSSRNTISNNTIHSNNEEGICLENSNSNTISDNNIFDNDCGIGLLNLSNNNIISNNRIHSNNEEGIGIGNSNSNTISDNIISDNGYGIGLWDLSNNNLIYNNYFNNTNNAYDDGNNIWNITKTAGTNIIGGPYLGGNYWSDYKGIDTDEDGLGDWLTPYSCSGEIENGGDYLPLSFLSLEPGDLLLCRSPGSVVPGFWTHVGMYIGDGKVVEALPKPGVTNTSVADWNCPTKTCVEALRVKTTDEIRNKAVSFALSQVGKPYDWCWWQKDADGEAWYCSELVWAAYLKASDGTINIEHGPDITGITPTEIDLDDDTEVISEHKERIPKRGFWIITKSPVDLNVTDPDNLSIDKESTGISGAIYGEDDLDDDGDPDDWIGIPEQKIGNYLITVIPEPDATPTDTYTLEVFTEDTTIILAENVSVSEIPTEPYIFESKALTFDTGSPADPYPSIPGIHNGTMTPSRTIIATKLYTYACEGTGGHTEYARIWNVTWNATATWKGYVGDWHNITFDKLVVLMANETYNYIIKTSSYPQIHHTDALQTASGWINCTEFLDANGMRYNNWIPAIRLF